MNGMMKFTKMHGAGNDYVYVDCTAAPVDDPSRLAVAVSDRHFGVGSDGLVLICPSEAADFRMRMFNADGSEAQMCGNASRCVGKYVYDKGLTRKKSITLETLAGIKRLDLMTGERGDIDRVRVDMGIPALAPEEIPVKTSGIVLDMSIEAEGQTFPISCVSMGNPHAVIFVEDVDAVDLQRIGPAIEHHPLFPERTNVEFVQMLRSDRMKIRVWERGAGETLACGTGACASLVAAALRNRCGRKATALLRGGELEIEWDMKTLHVFMTGPAAMVFEGEFLYD